MVCSGISPNKNETAEDDKETIHRLLVLRKKERKKSLPRYHGMELHATHPERKALVLGKGKDSKKYHILGRAEKFTQSMDSDLR